MALTRPISARGQVELPREWRRWIAESLLLGTPAADIVRTVVDQTGASDDVAEDVVRRIGTTPAFEVAEVLGQRLRKLESLLEVQRTVRELSTSATSVARCRNLDGARFLEEFYAENRPVLIEDLAISWPAVGRWTPQYLQKRFGAEQVEVMAGREADERYEVNWENHKHTMLLGDYIDHVIAAGDSNDLYLVANNRALDHPGMRPLLDDLAMDVDILDPAAIAGHAFLWFGPGGTVTPLHHDSENVLFVQIYGNKRIRLISPFVSHRVYNQVSVYSEVDPDHVDHARHPRFGGVRSLEVLVHPGEALFIPVGWWHHVEALETSISVSFTNFLFPNTFSWQLPTLDR